MIATTLQPDIGIQVLEILRRATEPLTVDKIRRSLPKPYRVPPKRKAELQVELERLATDGRIVEWPKKGASPRYWNRDPRQCAVEGILAAAENPLSPARLAQAASKRAFGYPAKLLPPLIVEMIKDGRLFREPPVGGTRAVVSLQPVNPEAYRAELEGILRQIARNLDRLGAPVESLVRTALSGEAGGRIEEAIRKALLEIEPRKGLLVAAARLREWPSLVGYSKRAFDEAAWRLYHSRVVFLHEHAAPFTLSVEERETLIDDGRGRYYLGLSLRDDV